MKKESMNDLINMVQNLSTNEKYDLVEQIMNMLNATPDKSTMVNTCHKMIENQFDARPNCPHCQAKAQHGNIIKRGFKNGVQRYQCKLCGRKFVATTKTVFEHTHKDAATWREFIYMTITGASLKKCAAECGIAYQTAFNWRHKILNAFRVEQEKTNMSGIVEMDEMLMPISYKGNHVQGAFGKREINENSTNDMPRKAFKRGSDNKSNSAKDKVCIFCMVANGDKSFYATAPGVGFMKNDMLEATVSKHVNKYASFVLVDEYQITKNYLTNNGYQHMALKSNTSDNPKDHKPLIVDENLHLQHINAMHRHIRRFLKDYCGVSSKYLENYISLYVWLKALKETKDNVISERSIERLSFPDCCITGKEIKAFPAIPRCA